MLFVHRFDSFSRDPEARPAAEPLPKSKEHHQSHPLRSLPTVAAPSRLSRRRGPRSSHWLLARPCVACVIPPLRLPQGRPSLFPPPVKSFLSHSMCSSLFIIRAVASSCYFADRRPRLRSRYSEKPSGLLPIPQAGAAKQVRHRRSRRVWSAHRFRAEPFYLRIYRRCVFTDLCY